MISDAAQNDTIHLYSLQTEQVAERLQQEGRVFCKRDYVRRKYQESAPIFLTAYDWFVREAPVCAHKPIEAELPYWAFASLESVDKEGGCLLRLEVPRKEAVFFDVYEWNKVLKLQFLGANEQEEQEFRAQLREYGVKQDSDVLLTNFYPVLKRQVQQSWQRLFRHHEGIMAGHTGDVAYVQAALWQIKAEWLR